MYSLQAPSALLGPSPETPPGYEDRAFDYVRDVVLTANQILQDSVDIEPDADFVAVGLYVATSTGAFSLRWSDSRQYYVSNSRIASANLSTDPAAPYPIFPQIVLPKNGRIGIEIGDTSGAGNTIQLVWRGWKRFKV